jgi:gliding motility-associated-like protein
MRNKISIRLLFKVLFMVGFLFYLQFAYAQKISMGQRNVVYICPDSTISAIGLNSGFESAVGLYFRCQLGDGTDINRNYPVKVKGLHNAVAVNALGSLALLSDGTVWQWTKNNEYNLHKLPIDSVVYISVGLQVYIERIYCAIRKDGSLWVWGEKDKNQTYGWGFTDSLEKMDMPKVKKVEAGQHCVIALCEDGSVWTWGHINVDGNGNDDPDKFYIYYPSKVNTITDVVDVCAGRTTVFALKSDGTVWEWGVDVTHIVSNNSYPVKLNISDVKFISTGIFEEFYAIKNDGTLWEYKDSISDNHLIWGRPYCHPRKIEGIENVQTAYSTTVNSLAVDNFGNMYRWGDNRYGELGNFTNFPIDSPEIMPHPCVAVDCDTITQNPDLLVLDTTVHPGLPITLETSPSEADLYWWYPQSNVIKGRYSRQAVVSITEDTEFSAVIMDIYGCMRKERYLLRSKCDPATRLGMDSVSYPGAAITFNAGEGDDYLWTPTADLSCTNCQQTTASIHDSSSYFVTYTDIYGCTVNEQFVIRIRDCDTIIKANNSLLLDTLIAPGNTINLIASNAEAYTWLPSEGLSCDSCRSTNARIYENTEYAVTLTDKYHCQWIERFKLTNHCDSSSLFNPEIVLDTVTYPEIQLLLSVPRGRKYLWQPIEGLSCNDCSNPVASVNNTIRYIVSVTDSFYCTSNMRFDITVRNCDTIVLQNNIIRLDTTLDYRTEIPLKALYSYNGYSWAPAKGLSCTDCQDPILRATKTAEYTALTYDYWRCPVYEIFRVDVINSEIIIPNVFTPNNDNINDYFEIKGLIQGSSLFIYDKQGILVFSSSNYDGQWNGNDLNGKPLNEGTYWYVLDVPDENKFKGWVYIKR